MLKKAFRYDDEVIFYFDETQDQQAVHQFRHQRQEHYDRELWKSQNVTIVNHAFNLPCYQQVIVEIIKKYRGFSNAS